MPVFSGETPGAKNLDSYRSRAEVYGIFGRFEKFSFWGSGGRLKVGVAVFSFVISMEILN